jgi:hypothetical protein
MILGGMFAGLGTMTYLALDDPGFALESNYYDKAVHWDRSQAEAEASRELGLTVSVARALKLTASGHIDLELQVTDRGGAAYGGADVLVEAFANAHAAHVEQLRLREAAAGAYTARIVGGARGLWELRVSVVRGRERFQQVLRVDVSKGDAA